MNEQITLRLSKVREAWREAFRTLGYNVVAPPFIAKIVEAANAAEHEPYLLSEFCKDLHEGEKVIPPGRTWPKVTPKDETRECPFCDAQVGVRKNRCGKCGLILSLEDELRLWRKACR